jgi:hypothetical protein
MYQQQMQGQLSMPLAKPKSAVASFSDWLEGEKSRHTGEVSRIENAKQAIKENPGIIDLLSMFNSYRGY